MNILDLAPRLLKDPGPWKANFDDVVVRVIPSAMPRHFYLEVIDKRFVDGISYPDTLIEWRRVAGTIATELLTRGALPPGLECTWEKDSFRSYDRYQGAQA